MEFLVGPGRGINNQFFSELQAEGAKASLTFARIRDLYANYQYSDLVQHPAVVLMPYQVRGLGWLRNDVC